MPDIDLKIAIQDAIQQFEKKPLAEAATTLLETLGYQSEKRLVLIPNTSEQFREEFDPYKHLNVEKAFLSEWSSVDLLFQITDEEIRGAMAGRGQLFVNQKVDNTIINSYLFFAVGLRGEQYTRTKLAAITREINKLFLMPVMVIFKHGQAMTIAIIARRLHKRDPGRDVLEKVTLIKDIAINQPHRAHVEILYDLSVERLAHVHGFTNFVELQRAWEKTLDTSELNKKFFREVANWYFWAVKNVTFPEGAGAEEETRNAISVIRLITRLIFVWFIKEKGLVPDVLFDLHRLKDTLNYIDPKNSTYYKAILQNLFFATLNTEMGKDRRFRGENEHGRDQHYMVHNVYRYKRYFQDPGSAINVFAGIPFLNGGLFECLDRPDKDDPKKILRVDGFSDRDNPLQVPDELFFGAECGIDLNDIYDTKNKKYKVRGLIHIFNSYKFTIEENTPIEEEIALDPELLGKVFENLLAAYNPETGTTARKQTGSFYTPRDIVNYMVDESLIAYLESRLEGAEDVQERLRHLLAYNDEKPQFNDSEIGCLIDAIDNIKVLDPACGSGAFPMGMLHKSVHILSKLDPFNTRWCELQLQKAINETEEAYRIGDHEERKSRLVDIEEVFNDNTSDYGRKLYLIENCIYGVDIQPIAIQISKLRFFISLIVDQKVDRNKQNLGIRPLPNLETKFVAANTLIGIEKPQQMKFRNPLIDMKEKELAYVRAKLFSARTLQTKRKLRAQDAAIRAEIAELLNKDGWVSAAAAQIAGWDPYDQNASAEFFDQEWMFGIEGGFDVVIGNPPYVSYGLRNAQSMITDEKERIKSAFPESAEYKISMYALFMDMAIRLAKDEGGLQTLIVPDSFLLGMYFSKIRGLILKKNHIINILWIPRGVFESVVGYSVVYLFRKTLTPKSHNRIVINSVGSSEAIADRNFTTFSYHQSYFEKIRLNKFRLFFCQEDMDLVEKVEKIGIPLEKMAKITTGVRSKKGKGAVIAKAPKGRTWKKGIISSSQVLPYIVIWNGDWLNIKSDLLFAGGWDARYVEKPKIMIRQTCDSIIAGIDYDNLYHLNNTHTCAPLRNDIEIKYLSAILNCRLLNKYYHLISLEENRVMAQTDIEALEMLPIPNVPTEKQKSIIQLVDCILAAKRADPAADTSALEAEIDRLVYGLYGLTEKEIGIVEGIS